jgi:hypothetical protein
MKMISEDFVTSEPVKVAMKWVGISHKFGPHLEIREIDGPVHRIIPENQKELVRLMKR